MSPASGRRILLVAPFMALPEEVGYNRFVDLARRLTRRGHRVTLLTSRFSHFRKAVRASTAGQDDPALAGVDLRLIHEPGYRRNVGVTRAASHAIFLQCLRRFLAGLAPDYDLVYAAMPLVGSAAIAGRWARRKGMRFVVDIQDPWPEAQAFALPGPTPLWRGVLAPAEGLARRTYARADAVFAVSESFLRPARRAVAPGVPVRSIYLGTDTGAFLARPARGASPATQGLQLVYIGTLGTSYDFETVFQALAQWQEAQGATPHLTLYGDGPRRRELEARADAAGLPVTFRGTVPQPRLAEELAAYDLAINPYYPGALQSVTNKLADYLAAGLPVINAANNAEVVSLLAEWQAGQSYPPGDADGLRRLLAALAEAPGELDGMSEQARALALRHFDRDRIYAGLVEQLEAL